MATRIRLRRMGHKKQASYRIVVADKDSPRDGRFIEAIGHYNPRTDPATISVQGDRARHWLSEGALPTDTVRSLLKKAGVFSAAASAAPAAPAAPADAPEPATPADAPEPATPADASEPAAPAE